MRRAPLIAPSLARGSARLVAISVAYCGLAGLCIYLWLWRTHGALPSYVALVCALPSALVWLVTRVQSARERGMRGMAGFMFLPILLIMWAPSVDLADMAAPATPAERAELDVDALFTGAIARQDTPPAPGTTLHTRGATFPDGSELRLLQFADAREAESYLALLMQSFQTHDATLGAHRGKSAKLAANLMVYWERHGAILLELRAGTDLLARSRLEAHDVPLPTASAPAARASERPSSLAFVLSYVIVHALCFVTLTLWAAAATTRVNAHEDAAILPAAALLAQIDALPRLGVRCNVSGGANEGERVVHMRPAVAERAQHLTLRVDEAGRVVRCFERETTRGAAPRDADEARMRGPGERSYDPTGPRAQRVWNVKRLATPIDAERLAALPLSFANGAPELPHGYGETLDADGIIHLVCALVTSAGYDYQPVLALFHGGTSGSRADPRASLKP